MDTSFEHIDHSIEFEETELSLSPNRILEQLWSKRLHSKSPVPEESSPVPHLHRTSVLTGSNVRGGLFNNPPLPWTPLLRALDSLTKAQRAM